MEDHKHLTIYFFEQDVKLDPHLINEYIWLIFRGLWESDFVSE